MGKPSLKDAWVAAVGRELVDVPQADTVLSHVDEQLVRTLELVRQVDTGSRSERARAIGVLIRFAHSETPELIDLAAAAVQLGIRNAGKAMGWSADRTDDIARRALRSLVDLDRRLEAAAVES